MITLAIILAVLLLICLLRVGVIAQYGEDGFSVRAAIGPIKINVLPRGEKKRGAKKTKATGKKGMENPDEKTEKAGPLEVLKNQLPSIIKALSRIKKKLRINELTIHYMAAGTDPAAAALCFGGVSAGYGVIIPFLENNFNIKKRDLRAAVNFEAAEPYIYVKARISFAVWEIFYIGFGLFLSIVTGENRRAKIRKAV